MNLPEKVDTQLTLQEIKDIHLALTTARHSLGDYSFYCRATELAEKLALLVGHALVKP
jgi:hypothetical protein